MMASNSDLINLWGMSGKGISFLFPEKDRENLKACPLCVQKINQIKHDFYKESEIEIFGASLDEMEFEDPPKKSFDPTEQLFNSPVGIVFGKYIPICSFVRSKDFIFRNVVPNAIINNLVAVPNLNDHVFYIKTKISIMLRIKQWYLCISKNRRYV